MNTESAPIPYCSDLGHLQLATSILMTRFYVQGCPGIAGAVVNHLEAILDHRDIRASADASQGYRALLDQWTAYRERVRELAAQQRNSPAPAQPRSTLH
jgi:hypothetical protein